jgi:hypothetical protein
MTKQFKSPLHKKQLSAKQQRIASELMAELASLAKLSDSEIDLSQMPEELDWTSAEVGKYFRPAKKQKAKRRLKRT